VGEVSLGHAGRAVATPSGSAELGRFLHALSKEKIPFLTAANSEFGLPRDV
jgi:hypothetical protein